MTAKSPYLEDPSRLADVIAAIQALGAYPKYMAQPETWSKRISGTPDRARHWQKVFEEHPEFFRFSQQPAGSVSLIWRQQQRKRYDADRLEVILHDQYILLDDAEKQRLSREPLAPDQINALIDVATNMHARAIEHKREIRWWFAPLLGFLGAAAGGLLTGWWP